MLLNSTANNGVAQSIHDVLSLGREGQGRILDLVSDKGKRASSDTLGSIVGSILAGDSNNSIDSILQILVVVTLINIFHYCMFGFQLFC